MVRGERDISGSVPDWRLVHQSGVDLCADHLTKPIVPRSSWCRFCETLGMETLPSALGETFPTTLASKDTKVDETEVNDDPEVTLCSARLAKVMMLTAIGAELCQGPHLSSELAAAAETVLLLWSAGALQ